MEKGKNSFSDFFGRPNDEQLNEAAKLALTNRYFADRPIVRSDINMVIEAMMDEAKEKGMSMAEFTENLIGTVFFLRATKDKRLKPVQKFFELAKLDAQIFLDEYEARHDPVNNEEWPDDWPEEWRWKNKGLFDT